MAIQTWVRNNDKTKARAEEREKNIEWIKRLFTAWRVSHAERKEAGEDDPEEDETPVEIPPSAVTIYPKGTPVPTPTVEVQVLETRVDLSNVQRHDLEANDRSGSQKCGPCARGAR